MPSAKLSALANLSGAQVPGDLAYIVDVSAGVAGSKRSTLNDLFAVITKNITDLSLAFQDGAAASVSSANQGKLIYNDSAQAFQVSVNGGAYASVAGRTVPLGGTGAASFTANGVLFGNGAGALQVTAQGAANSILTANAGAPSFSQAPTINTSVQIGVASSQTGTLALANSAGATLTRWQAGNAASTLTFIWPVVDPVAGQVLSASAPSAGDVTLSWATLSAPPFADTQTIIKGSADATKLLRFEIDGFTTGTTRILTPINADYIIAGSAAALTSGRVPFVTTGGLLLDSANFSYDTANNRLVLGVASSATGQLRFAVSGDANVTTLQGGDTPASDVIYKLPADDPVASEFLKITSFGGGVAVLEWAFTPMEIGAACSDEITALTTGTAKVTFRLPRAMTLTAVRASLTTAQASGSIFTVDINEGGVSILSTKITIDNTEKTSTSAATPPVISDANLADDAEITVDIDQIGNGSATGLKIWLIGNQA